jgi:hypothetical protein
MSKQGMGQGKAWQRTRHGKEKGKSRQEKWHGKGQGKAKLKTWGEATAKAKQNRSRKGRAR